LSTPFRLLVPSSMVREMVEQARAEAPNECCGLLAGRLFKLDSTRESDPPGIGKVLHRYALVNCAENSTRFLSDAESMFAAVRDMRHRQLDILAIYHSHPVSDPIPSRTDLENNYSSEVVNLIISLKEKQTAIRAWWLTDKEYREADWEVVELNEDSTKTGNK
jgi:[CysO sulfur-carrier protein]-S-L-cysteine hydrolase